MSTANPTFPDPPTGKLIERRKKGKKPTPARRVRGKKPLLEEPGKKRRYKNPSIMNSMHRARAKRRKRFYRMWRPRTRGVST